MRATSLYKRLGYHVNNLNTVKETVWRNKGLPEKQNQTNTTNVEIRQSIDARGLYCPIPVYKTRQAVLEAKSKEVIEILADDPAAEEDISRWAKRTGNTILSLEHCDDYIRFLIQKTDR